MVHNIKPEALRAGFAAMAKKDKTRPALQALCLEPDGSLVATDGVVLAVCRNAVTPVPSERILFEIVDKRALKKAADNDDYIIDTDDNLLYLSHTRGREIRDIAILEGDYPEYQHAIPQENHILPTAYVGFNTQLLLRASQALGADLVEIAWYGPGTLARIRPRTETAETADITVYVMPLQSTDRAKAYQAFLAWAAERARRSKETVETEENDTE